MVHLTLELHQKSLNVKFLIIHMYIFYILLLPVSFRLSFPIHCLQIQTWRLCNIHASITLLTESHDLRQVIC